MKHKTPVSSTDVMNWPEFEALAVRLGVDLSLPIHNMVIDLECGEDAVVVVGMQAIDATAEQQTIKLMEEEFLYGA